VFGAITQPAAEKKNNMARYNMTLLRPFVSARRPPKIEPKAAPNTNELATSPSVKGERFLYNIRITFIRSISKLYKALTFILNQMSVRTRETVMITAPW